MFNNLKNFAGMKGFRKEKKLTKEQLQRQQEAKAFSDDYIALCTKHKKQLIPIIKRHPNGAQEPDFAVGEYEPPKLKDWGEAAAENLEVQKKCRHLNENNENCKTCGVRIADQDESGTGVTEDFIKVKEQKIVDYREREKEHNTEKPE